MTYYFKFFALECKRFIRVFPYALLGAMVLLFFIGTIAFCASSSLYAAEGFEVRKVAILSEDRENPYITFGMGIISQMDSTSSTLSFEFYEEEEAYRALKNGDVIAILYFPDNVVDGILYGSNIPIEVIFPTGNDISSVFLTEITGAFGSMLSSAQAAIYASTDLYYALGMQSELSNAYDVINLTNIRQVLDREDVFVYEQSGLEKEITTMDYYTVSGILFFFLLFGSSFAFVMQPESEAFMQLHRSLKKSEFLYLLCRMISCFLFYFLWCFLLYFAMEVLNSAFSLWPHFTFKINGQMIGYFLILSVFMSAYNNLIYFALKDITSAILALFFIGTGMLLLSGGILPSVFLPEQIRTLGQFLPSAYLHRGLTECFLNGKDYPYLPLILYSLVFLFFTWLLARKGITQNWRRK